MMSEQQRAERRQAHMEVIDYAASRIAGETPRASALAAGLTPARAAQATRTMEPRAKTLIRDYLDEHGATRADVAAAVGRALRAKKVAKDGTVLDDAQAQIAAARFVAEIHGETKQAGDGISMTINLTGPAVEAFLRARSARDDESVADYIDVMPSDPSDPRNPA